MSHHTDPEAHAHDRGPHHRRANSVFWRTLISMSTVAIALVLHVALGLGVVLAVLIGFIVAACLTAIVYMVWLR